MLSTKLNKVPIFFLLIGFFVFFIPQVLHSTTMSSETYQVIADVIGGTSATSTSSNYIVQATTGEFFATTTQSSNYVSRGGFWETARGELSVSISSLTIGLGALQMNSVKSASVVVTVTSTVQSGYVMQVVSDGNLRTAGGVDIDNVADGAITTGQEEYGIGTSGTDGQYNAADTSITTAYKTVATRSSIATGVGTTITFKASAGNSTETGNYSQSVTLFVTANL